MSIELIIAVFQNSDDQAGEVLAKLKELAKEGALEVEDVAVIAKTKDGEVEVQDPGDVDKKKGTVFGAVTGGLVGLLGGPVGAIIGAAAGAATGRVTANLADYGVSDSTIKDVEQQLQPGGSAIIMYVRLNWVDRAISRLEANGATVYHETIPEAGWGGADAMASAQQR
jgi:uncharacterized membrane protein